MQKKTEKNENWWFRNQQKKESQRFLVINTYVILMVEWFFTIRHFGNSLKSKDIYKFVLKTPNKKKMAHVSFERKNKQTFKMRMRNRLIGKSCSYLSTRERERTVLSFRTFVVNILTHLFPLCVYKNMSVFYTEHMLIKFSNMYWSSQKKNQHTNMYNTLWILSISVFHNVKCWILVFIFCFNGFFLNDTWCIPFSCTLAR